MPNSSPAGAPDKAAPAPASWGTAFLVYLEAPTLRMLFLGFSAGVPLLLVFGTLSFWLREAGVDRTTIGYISWVALAYAFKWAWAPLVDRMPLPMLTRALGRRRAWLLLAQALVICGIVGMALTDPQRDLQRLVFFALLTAFASATQDIALDAYRIESAATEKQAALAAAYQTGYRVAMIWAGAGVLTIAARFDPSEATYEFEPWTIAYLAMATSMLVGVATVFLSPEPEASKSVQPVARQGTLVQRLLAWLRAAVVDPFQDFLLRHRWHAVLILSLIALYRISDVVMGVMSNPFYRDMGFTKDEVAAVSKVYGVVMTLVGAFLGGLISVRIGVLRTLFLGGVLSALTNLLFAWLATRGHDLTFLVIAISADNLAAGIASSAFIAYLSGLTSIAYSATQYALFSSVMLLLPKFLAGYSGLAVDTFGYVPFFIGTALMGIPVLVLIWLAARVQEPPAVATAAAPQR